MVLEGQPSLYGFKYDSGTACGLPLYLCSYKLVGSAIAKAEYISVGSCCAQLLWMKATLSDFGIKFKQVPLLCDNKSVVSSPTTQFNIQGQSI